MSFFRSKSNKDHATLIFDVQSSLVRASLVTKGDDGKPHHWYSISQSIPRKEHTNSTQMTKSVLHAIEALSQKIVREGLKNVERVSKKRLDVGNVHFVLSSPWAISHSRTIRAVYEKDTEITKSLVKSIIDSEENILREEFNRKDSMAADGAVDVIEKKIFEVKLNGYPVTVFEGRKAHTLEVSCAVTMSSRRMIKHMENALGHAIRPKNLEFHSALLLHYIALRNLLGGKDEYISIHVHGELTDVVVVKKGMCSSTASYPFGSTTLVRKVAASLRQPESITESTLDLYSRGMLHDGEQKKVAGAVTTILSGWVSLFHKSILNATDKEMVPRMVLLSCHSHHPIFERVLADSEEWPVHVTAFDDTAVDRAVVFEKLSERSPLLGMYSLAISPDSRKIF